MIITVTFNPAIDKTAEVSELIVGGLNRLSNIRQDAGGKGINVSKTLKALNTESIAAGFTGGNTGRFIEDSLHEEGIETCFIQVEGETRTNLKVLNAEMELTELNEPGPVVSSQKIRELTDRILEKADSGSWVILSGNVGPGVPKDVYRTMIEELNSKNIRCILDADGELFKKGIQAGPYAIKPNRYELSQYFCIPEEELNSGRLIELARRLLSPETKLAVVSMGKDGSIFVTEDEVFIAEALSIPYQSAVGAGDAMVAAIADGLSHQMKLKDLVTWAVAVSAGACMTQGTQPADLKTVLELREKVKYRNWEKKNEN